MSNEKEILKNMLVDESNIIQNLANIVQKAKDIFVLEQSSGKVIFKNYSNLTNPQKISCILIGKYFAKRLELVDDHTITVSEISKDLDIPKTTLSSPLKSLRNSGDILYEKSRYRINPHKIEEIVNSFFKPKKIKPTRKRTRK